MIESLAHVASEIAKTKTEVSEASHFDSRAELSKGDVARNNPDTRALVRGKYPEDATYEIKDGQKHYYDVNQRLYRVDKNLVPNNSYELNGYKYKTDDQGRISSVTGKLHLKERQGRLQGVNAPEKADRVALADGVHRALRAGEGVLAGAGAVVIPVRCHIKDARCRLGTCRHRDRGRCQEG